MTDTTTLLHRPALRTGRRRWLALMLAGLCLGLGACGGDDDAAADDGEAAFADDPQPTPDADMKAVLDELAALGARPVHTLAVAQARAQPTAADAVRSLLQRTTGRAPEPELVGGIEDRSIEGANGNMLAVRIYTPAGAGPFPLLLYIHGGGWVLADIDSYDASARALTNAAGAIVVSTHYRQAPEASFPSAHDDTYAAWKWMVANAAALNGIPGKVAVAGESAGGNMAASIALRTRDDRGMQPLHQLLIYPVTEGRLDTPSAQQNRNAQPLDTASLAWFYDKYLPIADDRQDRRFAVLRADVAGAAPATVITADIDPLRSEGRYYAERLAAAGVPAAWINYSGVTHEFFGMGAAVAQSRAAVARAGAALRAAYTGVRN